MLKGIKRRFCVRKISATSVRKTNSATKENGSGIKYAAPIPIEKAIDKKKRGGMEISRRSKVWFSGSVDKLNIRKMIYLLFEVLERYEKKQDQSQNKNDSILIIKGFAQTKAPFYEVETHTFRLKKIRFAGRKGR